MAEQIKVVHLSSTLSESSAATMLHKALLAEGVSSKCLVWKDGYAQPYEIKEEAFLGSQATNQTSENSENGSPTSENSNPSLRKSAYAMNVAALYKRISWRVRRFLHKQQEKKNRDPYKRRMGTSLSFDAARTRVACQKEIQEADIIHLHWICNFLSAKEIAKLASLGKPVVWTCHDSWPFTGGCHVKYDCKNYQKGCGCCPELTSNDPQDSTGRLLARKQSAWKDCSFTMVAPSKWMVGEIAASSTLGHQRIEHIPNTLDETIFHPYETEEAEKALGYQRQNGKIHILMGTAVPHIPYKGYRYFVESLKLLREQHPLLAEKIVLELAGGAPAQELLPEGYQVHTWGFVSDRKSLAQIYSLCDALVYPSIDDNLPNMVMESLSCGTPVVCFDTCGEPDMVCHRENGYVARFEDTQDLMEGLVWVLENNEGNALGKAGNAWIRQEFGMKKVANQHVELYRELLREKS